MQQRDLIARGYFPRELPPPFRTESLADFTIANPVPPTRPTSKLCSHSLIRFGSLRRKLSIPNPAFFLETVKLIENHWADIKLATQKSKLSRSQPIHTPHPKRSRSIAPLLDFCDRPRERARSRAVGSYVLQTDISQFYQSIYTHCIPWAIHGKSVAKQQKRNAALFGNQLDKLIRNSQDGQTLGIPIGPDTSLVIAELILCAADVELQKRMANSGIVSYQGFRYSDDYELTFVTRSEAETALSQLQQVLSEFELSLNPIKTSLIALPCALDAPWVLELSDYKFSQSTRPQIQMQDIIRYFDRAFQISREFPQDPVLKYAISRMGNFEALHSDNWSLLEDLLLQAIMLESGAMRNALSIIETKRTQQFPINLEALEKNLNIQILRSAPLNHSSEVAWAIWAIIVFNLTIHRQAAQAISNLEDSVVALLALDAHQRGRIQGGLSLSLWEQFLSEDELYGQQWLLAYEMNYQGYSANRLDYVLKDPWFSQLKKNKVSFYDRSVALSIPPSENSGPSGMIT